MLIQKKKLAVFVIVIFDDLGVRENFELGPAFLQKNDVVVYLLERQWVVRRKFEGGIINNKIQPAVINFQPVLLSKSKIVTSMP